MAKTYFTLTGTKHYYGRDFLEKGMQVKLIKEPDNDYDREAIRVELPGWKDRICCKQPVYSGRREHERRQTLRQVREQRNCNRTADN